jgi:threonyl-tRNA synthetase
LKVLQLHCEYLEYEPVKREVEEAEPAEKKPVKFNDVVAFFISVEKGDDDSVVKRAAEEVKKSMLDVNASNLLIYPYSHLSQNLAQPKEARKILDAFTDCVSKYGLKVDRAPFGWNKSFSLKVKGHPLAERSKSFEPEQRKPSADSKPQTAEVISEALKEEEKLKSEWLILEPNGNLVAVKDFDFKNHPNLEKLAKYEISKVRAAQQVPPHVTLMKRLAIADYEPASDRGNVRFYPKGRLIKSLLEKYVSREVKAYGGLEIESPLMYDFQHPSLASYLNRFPARQYIVRSDDKDFFLRFAACFGQFLMLKDAQISYKDLPLKIYELTRYSFRREKSGEVVGLRRLRAFTMPDCHCLCGDLDQAKKEFIDRFKLSTSVVKGIGFSDDDYEMAIRFTEEFYDSNRDFVNSLVNFHGRPVLVERWSKRFFYFVLKWEFNFIDNLDKASALSTDQIDVENAERFGIMYVDERGNKKYPIILHNSPSGAIERDIYGLLERAYRLQKSNKPPTLPTWLSPTQVRFIPVSSISLDLCQRYADILSRQRVRADIDDREETVPKKVREAEREWIPYIAVLGEKEAESDKFPVRVRNSGSMKTVNVFQLSDLILQETDGKPYLPLPLPQRMSLRPVFVGG